MSHFFVIGVFSFFLNICVCHLVFLLIMRYHHQKFQMGSHVEPVIIDKLRQTVDNHGFYMYMTSYLKLLMMISLYAKLRQTGWLGSRVVCVLDSGAEGPGFKLQSRRCRVTVLGKLFTPIVSLFTKQQNW